jgi:osmotically-inducible protein OsmY
MRIKSYFWQALTISMTLALAFPLLARGESEGSKSPSSNSPSVSREATQGSERMQPSAQMNKAMPEQASKAMMDKAATEADRTLNQHIRQALSSDATLAAIAPKIQLESDNGTVTLHGSVTDDKQKSEVMAKVSKVTGVKKVTNQLQTATD